MRRWLGFLIGAAWYCAFIGGLVWAYESHNLLLGLALSPGLLIAGGVWFYFRMRGDRWLENYRSEGSESLDDLGA